MTAYTDKLHTDGSGVKTSARRADRGDGTSDWFHTMRTYDGGDTAQGARADAAVTDPTASATVVGLLKGLLSFLRTHATGLGKAEDTAHASGDVGVQALAVRRDSAAASSGASGDYEPLQTDATGRLRTLATRDPDDTLSMATSGALAASLVVKASAGTLHALVGYSTTAQWLQVHDATSLPSNGAAPELSVPIAANEAFNVPLPGHVCATGITVAVSGTGPTLTVGAADTFVTAYYE